MWCRKSLLQRLRSFLHNAEPSQLNLSNLAASERYRADRLGLARRLHETLAQELAAIGYQLDAVISEDTLTPDVKAELRTIRMQVMETARSFRTEIYKLRKTDRVMLHAQLMEILAACQVEIDLNFPLLKEKEEELLIEALIEIARNTAKHAQASNFYLRHSTTKEGLLLELGDDGNGQISIKPGSFGLAAIDEVLRQISSRYSCNADDSGTHFRISINRRLFN